MKLTVTIDVKSPQPFDTLSQALDAVSSYIERGCAEGDYALAMPTVPFDGPYGSPEYCPVGVKVSWSTIHDDE